MRSKFVRLLTLILVFTFHFSYSQEKTITGVVSDDLGRVPGANIVVQGTQRGTTADFDGNFAIKASVGEVLEITFVGKKKYLLTVSEANNYNIVLLDEAIVGGDVVLVAYRTTTKPKVSTAVTTINSETIQSRPNASFVQTLQSQVAGLNISTGSGQPGASSQIILRGSGSINGNIEPLFVIDGVPQNGDAFRSLNPNEIASVSVLKDAGATAIYGNRGANGVILVATKRGSFEKPLEVNYITTTGFTKLQGTDYNLFDSRGLLALEKSREVGTGNDLTDAEIAAFDVNTDWNDVFFRTGITQNHTLNLSSGGANLSSFTSFGYMDQQGILVDSDLKRFNFRNNLTGRSSNKKFNYSTNVSVNFSRRNEPGSLGTGGVNQNYVLGANNSLPYVSPSEYTGSQDLLELYNADGTLKYTPLFLLDKLATFERKIDELKMIGGVSGSYKLTKNLELSSRLGLDYTQSNGLTFQDPISFNTFLFLGDGQEFGGTESLSFNRSLLVNSDIQLSYSKVFNDKHTLDASIFSEYIKGHNNNFGFTQTGLDPKVSSPGSGNGYIPYDNTNDFYVPTVFAGKADAGLFSYFGLVDYDYDAKYGFSGTIRRDASYRFNTSNRWGTFWSVSGRWNIDKETFMDGSVFDVLKLRASYGTNGNQDVLATGYFGAANLTRSLYDSTVGYGNLPAYGVVQLGNDDLKWEVVTQGNVGLDFEVFKSRLRGSADVYQKTTTDLYQPVGISAINAITVINANFGTLRNRGVELQFAYDLIRSKADGLNLTLNFNGAYNKNEIIDLPEEDGLNWDGESLTVNQEGGMLNEYYTLQYAGVNTINGNLLFYDKDGNVTENPDPSTDRYFTGKSRLPKIQGGFGFDIDYKGFYASTLFSYVTDVYRYDYDYAGLVDYTNIGVFNVSTDLLDSWSPQNTDGSLPAFGATNISLQDFSDRFIVDASYLRLRFSTIGYNFSQEMLKNTFLTGAKVFVNAENMFTWSKWRGWDAESTRSADQYQYPTPRIVSFGVELKF